MGFTKQDIENNKNYFQHKLEAEKQRNDVLQAVEGKAAFDFVLLDTRGREAFAQGHIPGSWNFGHHELEQSLSLLPKDKELITYCWGHD
ncbi:MAG TPA: rhodanese-like domain-containing protein [Candidatus Angelobacter sp.]|nr:rhodanese-like domain-containing protein [Candidatus Angelobacter sp.]